MSHAEYQKLQEQFQHLELLIHQLEGEIARVEQLIETRHFSMMGKISQLTQKINRSSSLAEEN